MQRPLVYLPWRSAIENICQFGGAGEILELITIIMQQKELLEEKEKRLKQNIREIWVRNLTHYIKEKIDTTLLYPEDVSQTILNSLNLISQISNLIDDIDLAINVAYWLSSKTDVSRNYLLVAVGILQAIDDEGIEKSTEMEKISKIIAFYDREDESLCRVLDEVQDRILKLCDPRWLPKILMEAVRSNNLVLVQKIMYKREVIDEISSEHWCWSHVLQLAIRKGGKEILLEIEKVISELDPRGVLESLKEAVEWYNLEMVKKLIVQVKSADFSGKALQRDLKQILLLAIKKKGREKILSLIASEEVINKLEFRAVVKCLKGAIDCWNLEVIDKLTIKKIDTLQRSHLELLDNLFRAILYKIFYSADDSRGQEGIKILEKIFNMVEPKQAVQSLKSGGRGSWLDIVFYVLVQTYDGYDVSKSQSFLKQVMKKIADCYGLETKVVIEKIFKEIEKGDRELMRQGLLGDKEIIISTELLQVILKRAVNRINQQPTYSMRIIDMIYENGQFHTLPQSLQKLVLEMRAAFLEKQKAEQKIVDIRKRILDKIVST